VKRELVRRIPFDAEIEWQELTILDWFFRLSTQIPFPALVGTSMIAEMIVAGVGEGGAVWDLERSDFQEGGEIVWKSTKSTPLLLWGSGQLANINTPDLRIAATTFAVNTDLRELEFPESSLGVMAVGKIHSYDSERSGTSSTSATNQIERTPGTDPGAFKPISTNYISVMELKYQMLKAEDKDPRIHPIVFYNLQ
jgi:hypothetical protein